MAEEARIIIDAQLQFRHDSEAAWLEHDPVLKAGEPAYTLGYPDRFKLGDGQSKWSELPYIKAGEGGGGGGGGSQSYESLTWAAIKGLTQADPSVLAQAFAVKQAYDELKGLIPSIKGLATLKELTALANLLNDMFTLEGDTIQTKYNFTTLKELSASGAGEEGEEGGDGATTLDGLTDVQIGDMSGLSNEEKESQVLGYDNATGMWINKIKMYHHKQTSARTEWVITHNLGKMPNVKIVDSLKQLCFGDIFYNDMNTVTIRFGAAESGDAYLD